VGDDIEIAEEGIMAGASEEGFDEVGDRDWEVGGDGEEVWALVGREQRTGSDPFQVCLGQSIQRKRCRETISVWTRHILRTPHKSRIASGHMS
jgi:hypothetical protein